MTTAESRIKRRWRAWGDYNPSVAAQWLDVLQRNHVLARMANALLLAVLVLVGCVLAWAQALRALVQRRGKKPRGSGQNTKPLTGDYGGPVPALVGSRQVLIVAELSIPQCKKYRVDHKVYMFAKLGLRGTVVSWRETSEALDLLQTASFMIAYRIPAVPEVLELYKEARRLGVTILYDIDDLVFDPASYASNSNLKRLPDREQVSLLEGARLYQEALRQADHGLASTPALAEEMKRMVSGQVFVLENAVDEQLLAASGGEFVKPVDDLVRIVYASGTTTHDADFALASHAIHDTLARYPQSLLVVMGPLVLPEELEGRTDRVRRMPFVGAEDFYRLLRIQDINLAPLEPGVFNDAKSCIKFIEASIAGLPTVASPAAEFKRVIRHGENGYLANDPSAWRDALASLVGDKDLRNRIAARARETVVELFCLDVLARARLNAMMTALYPEGIGDKKKEHSILLVNVFFAPISFGGATVVVNNLATALAGKPDCHITVFTGSRDETLAAGEVRRYAWRGITVFAVRFKDAGSEGDLNNPEITRAFERVMEVVRPDLVHFHSIQQLGCGLCDSCRQWDVPYYITLHDVWWLCERQFMVNRNGFCGQKAIDPFVCASCIPDPAFNMHRRFTLLKSLLGAQGLLTPGRYHRELHIASGIPADRIHVNKNGVLIPDRHQAGQTNRRTRQGPLVFAYAGGRVTHKGYFWMKSVFESLSERDYILRLVDVQAMLVRSAMRQDAWAISGQVEVVPPYNEKGLDSFYEGVDVFLFPSLCKESFGLTVREAMVRDVWVVSTDCGGPVEDLEPGVNGDVVALGDADGFRDAIRACLRDPARIRAYQNPLKHKIRSYEQQADELLGIYHRRTNHLSSLSITEG